MNVNPEMLRMLRNSRGLSQEGLAGLSKVSKKTVSRIESGHVAPSKIRSTTIERLAEALEVKPEDLANVPEEGRYRDPLFQLAGYRPLKAYINADTALAYEFVEYRYHLPFEWLVSMAPLFFMLLAEGSFTWRRQILAESKEAADHLEVAAAHLSFFYAGSGRREDGAAGEEASIAKGDLFGAEIREPVDFGYDHSENNPFADYLRQLATGIDPSVVELDPKGEKLSRLIPKHRIGHAELERITGGDFWAKFALERGYARIRAIPEELLGDSASEKRIAWLTERIPQKAREEFGALIDSLAKDKTTGPTNA